MMTQEIPVEKVGRISQATLWLLITAVISAALSALCHTHLHAISRFFFGLSTLLGSLAFLKLINTLSHSLPRSVARIIHWIHAMVFEVFSLLFIFSLRFFFKPKDPIGNPNGRPILLVHGYCNSGSVWIYQRYKLAQAGLGPIYTISLGHPFRPIHEYAQKVAQKAAQIAHETGRTDLILIGHSMGGLVSFLYALELAPPNTVTDLITVASPLAGTHAALLALGQNGREMRYNSPFVASLNQKIAAEKHIRLYHISTLTDQLIIPTRSALVGNDATRQFTFEDIGHTALLFSPRLAAALTYWIKKS
ncbi:MAG: alpha/beta fold hydrolase [Verrucomicrobiota bacterium]|nr:alpha/beta fold hydrolase [Verrucomicrobiota bacterium]